LTTLVDHQSSRQQLNAAGYELPGLLLAEDSPMERELLESFLQQGG